MTRRFCRYMLSPTELHGGCALLALASCVPPLFPELCPPGYEQPTFFYSGVVLMAAMITSFVLMVLTVVIHLLRLSNSKAFLQFFKYISVWVLAAGLFALMAIAADVPMPQRVDSSGSDHETDTLHSPHDNLLGPASLSLVLRADNVPTDRIVETPNLCRLENEHENILREFLKKSPRWCGTQNSDTFYSRPGHPVFIMPSTSGVPGLVHVCFRHLVEGAPLPQSYTVVKPGDAFPAERENANQVADLALDLGRNHYLLLAWRGTAHAETAHRAINAAIAAIDLHMQPLAEAPESTTIDAILIGHNSYEGDKPEIRFSEPPGQEGTYQAEIYANPGEPGTLLFYIRDMETGKTIKMLYCEARYSDNPHELFRHDIPGSLYAWEKKHDIGPLPENSPVFAIRSGSDHRYFGVALELWFKPTDSQRRRFRLLRRCYNVLPYDSGVDPSPAAQGATAENTPA